MLSFFLSSSPSHSVYLYFWSLSPVDSVSPSLSFLTTLIIFFLPPTRSVSFNHKYLGFQFPPSLLFITVCLRGSLENALTIWRKKGVAVLTLLSFASVQKKIMWNNPQTHTLTQSIYISWTLKQRESKLVYSIQKSEKESNLCERMTK